ncbi:hypothetical protein C7B62_18405 [Pleurocapsa sp. CCALA 161]|nr:hypothetical protein C7B62_18405 [Pleurocapsa sp. CCALA 161]
MVKRQPNTEAISIRVDTETLEWFRATAKKHPEIRGYQTLINDVLTPPKYFSSPQPSHSFCSKVFNSLFCQSTSLSPLFQKGLESCSNHVGR